MNEAKILEQLKELGKTATPTFMATVESVKEDFCSIKDIDGVLYPNVRLRANIDDKNEGLLIVPSVGSTVLVSRIGDSDMLYVEMFSKIDHVLFDGGENGGLVMIKELTDKINALVSKFNDHTHTLAIGSVAVAGSATNQSNLAPITVPAVTNKAVDLNRTDYENKKIKH